MDQAITAATNTLNREIKVFDRRLIEISGLPLAERATAARTEWRTLEGHYTNWMFAIGITGGLGLPTNVGTGEHAGASAR